MTKIHEENKKPDGDEQSVDYGITSEGKTGTEVDTSIAGQDAETKEEHMSEAQTICNKALKTKIKDTYSIVCSEFELCTACYLFPNPHGHQKNYGHCKVLWRDLEAIKWLNHTLDHKKAEDWVFGDTFALSASNLDDSDTVCSYYLCFGFTGKSCSPNSAKITLSCPKLFFSSSSFFLHPLALLQSYITPIMVW